MICVRDVFSRNESLLTERKGQGGLLLLCIHGVGSIQGYENEMLCIENGYCSRIGTLLFLIPSRPQINFVLFLFAKWHGFSLINYERNADALQRCPRVHTHCIAVGADKKCS